MLTIDPRAASTWSRGRFLAGVFRRLRSFAASRAASAAVEFAIVFPVAILLYIGASEVSQGVMTSRKLDLLTRTLVDLTSQQGTSQQTTSTPVPSNAVTAATLSTLMTSAQTLLSPQPTSTLQMTISAIDLVNNSTTNVCCTATVRWSYTQNGTLRPCNVNLTAGTNGSTNSLTTLPPALMPVGQQLPSSIAILIADVNYTFQPVFQYGALPFAPTMARNEYMFPRTSGQVVAGTLPSSGTQYGKVCY